MRQHLNPSPFAHITKLMIVIMMSVTVLLYDDRTPLAGSTGGADFIDYCAIAGVLFTLWLSLIYWKVCLLILILPPSVAPALTDCCAAAAATYAHTTYTITTLS